MKSDIQKIPLKTLKAFYDHHSKVNAKTNHNFTRVLAWDPELNEEDYQLYFHNPMDRRAVTTAHRQTRKAAERLGAKPDMNLFKKLIIFYSESHIKYYEYFYPAGVDFYYTRYTGWNRIPANDKHI